MNRITMGILVIGMLLAGCNAQDAGGLTAAPTAQQAADVGAVAAAVPTPYSAYIAAAAGLLLLLERLYQNYQAGGTGSTIASISSTITQAAQDITAIAATQSAHGQAIAKLASGVTSPATAGLAPAA